MDGICDVPGCSNGTYMGWRPLIEPRGRQVCEYHFRRHDDPADSFNLWDAFGFRRPAKMKKPVANKTFPESVAKPQQAKRRCCRACGAQREAGHSYCRNCAQSQKRHAHQERQRRYRQKRQDEAVKV